MFVAPQCSLAYTSLWYCKACYSSRYREAAFLISVQLPYIACALIGSWLSRHNRAYDCPFPQHLIGTKTTKFAALKAFFYPLRPSWQSVFSTVKWQPNGLTNRLLHFTSSAVVPDVWAWHLQESMKWSCLTGTMGWIPATWTKQASLEFMTSQLSCW